MSIHIINYASGKFLDSQLIQNYYWKKNYPSSYVHSFNKMDLEYLKASINSKKINDVLSIHRGDGLWAWKIILINHILSITNDNDVILYLDSGGLPVNNIDNIINKIRIYGNFFVRVSSIENEQLCREWLRTTNLYKTKSHLIENGNLFLHKKWDKRKIDILPENFIQIAGGIQGWLVTKKNKEIISHLMNQISLENYDDDTMITSTDYIEHRHDQSVLSELVGCEGLYINPDASEIIWHKSKLNDLNMSRVDLINF